MRRNLAVPLVALFGCLASCDLPRDPEGTLSRVESGTLRAGYIENPPWVAGKQNPRGVEADLVRELAHELGARVEWTRGTHPELVEALEEFEFDLVIGGFTRTSPGVQRVATTTPYHTTRVVLAVPAGMPLVREAEELRVAHAQHDLATRGRLRRRGAVPVPVPDLAIVRGPVAGPHWKLRALGFRDTGIELHRDENVLLVPPGENGFLVRVDAFLRSRRSATGAALARSAR